MESLPHPPHDQPDQAVQTRRGPAGRTPRNRFKQLACSSCRRKKVKCMPGAAGGGHCSLCQKLGLECRVPDFDKRKLVHSSKMVDALYARIAAMEAEVAEYRAHHSNCGKPTEATISRPSMDTEENGNRFVELNALNSNKADNMIVRLCGGHRQLNSDRAGRLRFFGPTSSLHLLESVTSSIFIPSSHKFGHQSLWQDDFSPEVQDHLLNLYWTYQHQVLPCIHKEAFLQDMRSGSTKFCSKLLMYCIFARAAAISNDPGLRAMALTEDAEDEPPYFIQKCVKLLEIELDNPGITTTQSLQLLSEMYCAISHDTKGWMYAGGAARLAYELGLHSDTEHLNADLSKLDKEVRHIVFWGCFNLDREWALYLGRPQSIKREDISVKRPAMYSEDESSSEVSWDMKILAAWTNLLEIVGKICDVLNGVQSPIAQIGPLEDSLRAWKSQLSTGLQYHSSQLPAIFLLHMQHASATILLHQPLAQFGRTITLPSSACETSRRICVEQACLIAQYLEEYYQQHGSVSTMSWVALHIIATALTSLIAYVAEQSYGVDMERQLACLRTCLGSLNELEKSHVVTRKVRKVIQQAIRFLNLDAVINGGVTISSAQRIEVINPTVVSSATAGLEINLPSQFSFADLFPVGPQFDMLNSFKSYFT